MSPSRKQTPPQIPIRRAKGLVVSDSGRGERLENAITVLIASSVAAERLALSIILNSEEDLSVIDLVGTVEEAANLVEEARPLVTLIEESLLDQVAAELFREIFSDSALRIVLLAVHRIEMEKCKSLYKFVDGYVLKGSTASEILDAVRLVAGRERSADDGCRCLAPLDSTYPLGPAS